MSQMQGSQKNRFQVSREVQEEFVNGIAQTMLSLAGKSPGIRKISPECRSALSPAESTAARTWYA